MTTPEGETRRMSRPGQSVALASLVCALLLPLLGHPALRAADIEEGQDAVLLDESLQIEILSDTLARVHHSRRLKVFTGKGIEDHDRASIFYNPSVKIREFSAAVISPQGKRADVKKPYFYDGAAFASYELYADTKHRTVQFPGLVPGATVEYQYEEEIRNLMYLQWFTRFDLQEEIPVRLKTLSVEAPSSFPLRFAVQGTPEATREEKDGKVVLRWQMRDVPALKSETWMPPDEDVVPHVQIYLRSFNFEDTQIDANDWNGIARWTRNLSRDREVPTDEVAAKA